MTSGIPLVRKEHAPTFTEEELESLNKYLLKKEKLMSLTTSEKLMGLYLNGRSISQINELFPQWSKGAVLAARHTYEWDKQKEKYIQEMMDLFRGRLVKSKLESVGYLMDQLTLTHKEFAREMDTYLKDPTEENLPKMRIRGNKEYREMLKALQEVLVLGDKPAASGGAQVLVNVNAAEGSVVQITQEEHSKILETLAEPKKLTE